MNSEVEGPHTEGSRGRPDPDPDIARSNLEHLVKRTYHARLQTAKRMQARAITWNLLLVASAVVTTIVATVQLVDSTVYGPRGPVLLVVVGIATLAASLLVTSANYSARAEVFFRGYRGLQRLWVDVAGVRARADDAITKFEERYQQLLDELPNHSEADFRIAFPPKLRRGRVDEERRYDPDELPFVRYCLVHFRVATSHLLTYLPVILALALTFLLGPAARWLFG